MHSVTPCHRIHAMLCISVLVTVNSNESEVQPVVQCMFADEEQSKLFAQKAVSTIGTILLTAADEQEPARPFFPVKTVLAAILRLAGQNNQKNLDRLWGQASCILTI